MRKCERLEPHFHKLPHPLRVTSAALAGIGGEKNGDDGVPMALGDVIVHSGRWTRESTVGGSAGSRLTIEMMDDTNAYTFR